MKKTKEVEEEKIPLRAALWAEVYEELRRHKVKFPKRFSGIGACYAGVCAIDRVLKKYKVKQL